MGTAAKLLLIFLGYCLAIAAAVIAVMINEVFVPADVSQSSGGMVAFGDLVLFLFATAILGMVPSWFLFRMMFRGTARH